MSGAVPEADSAPEPKSCRPAGWDEGSGIAVERAGEGTRERILEGSKQLLRDAGLGEPGTGCRWNTGKTGLFFSAKHLEIAKQGEIMQNILQKDPCP